MLQSIVGKLFPDSRYLTLEGAAVHFTGSSFDIICVLADLDEDEINCWRESPFQYGLFNEEAVPFFVTDFGKGLLFASPFNIKRVKAKNLINWLILPDQYVNLFLIEKNGYILKASRTAVLDSSFMKSLKNVLKKQYFKYRSEKEILARIEYLQNKYNVEAMYKKTILLQQKGNGT
jgi:hypothetical protein